ncbi:hypothetical protein [Paracoccus aminophilus]|nr:hypothetical protein [Paracoccus aminophilus]
MYIASSRTADERDLAILRRAVSGDSYSEISRDHGKGVSFSRVLVARIRDADLRESGEAASVVLAVYPAPIPRKVRAAA